MTSERADRLSAEGAFANGVTAAAVVRFILDYDESARIEDVAAYFALRTDDVVAALEYHARQLNGDRAKKRTTVVRGASA